MKTYEFKIETLFGTKSVSTFIETTQRDTDALQAMMDLLTIDQLLMFDSAELERTLHVEFLAPQHSTAAVVDAFYVLQRMSKNCGIIMCEIRQLYVTGISSAVLTVKKNTI